MSEQTNVESMQLGLTVIGNLYADLGTSEAFRANVKALQSSDYPLSYTQVNLGHVDLHDETIAIHQDSQFPINYFHLNAPEFLEYALPQLGKKFFKNHYNIGYWVIERDDFIPDSWLPAISLLDEIWTASNFTKEIIEKSTDIPVKVVPHPIDIKPDLSITRQYFGLPKDTFLFLFAFDPRSTSARKNPLGLIQSFKDAFPVSNNAPTLVIKTYGLSKFPNLRKAMHTAAQKHNIIFIDQYMSHTEVISLMNVCDVYVSLHRSEGFGLTMAEAMYLDKPVIATGWSGNMDYMNFSNSYPINYELVPIDIQHHQYQEIESIVNLYLPGSCTWADPDLEHAGQLMQHVYYHQEDAKIIADFGQQTIRSQNNPLVVSKVMIERVQEIYIDNPQLSMVKYKQPQHHEVVFEFNQLLPSTSGWYKPEQFNDDEYFQWTSEECSNLSFSLSPQSDYTLQFTICNIASEDILESLIVKINNAGIDIQQISYINNLRTYEGIVPQNTLQVQNDITLQTNRVIQVEGADNRQLGLGFMNLYLIPLENTSSLEEDSTQQEHDLHLQHLFQVWNNARQQNDVNIWVQIPILQFVTKTLRRIRNLGNLWADLYHFLFALLRNINHISRQLLILIKRVKHLETELETLQIDFSDKDTKNEQLQTHWENNYASLNQQFDSHIHKIEQLETHWENTNASLNQQFDSHTHKIEQLETHWENTNASLNQQFDSHTHKIEQLETHWENTNTSLNQQFDSHTHKIEQLETHWENTNASLNQQFDSHTHKIEQLESKHTKREQRIFFHTKRDIFQLQEIDNLLGILNTLETPLEAQQNIINISRQIAPDGNTTSRYDHQRQYIAYLNLKDDLQRLKVVNFGIEDGEFLSILADIGLSAVGIDTDINKINKSKNNEHTVSQMGEIAFLQDCQNNTLQGIYAYLTIQTLAWDDYLTFLNLAYEKLAVGGFILLETFNPLCYKGLNRFYMNPENTKPIPPQLLSLCLKVIRFKHSEYFFSHPVELKAISSSNTNYENYENYAILAYK
jgi:glycosyltransferase involved in cell wall biosynthesis